MLLRLGAILLALAVPTSFPGENSETLHQQYGQPIAETFLVRLGIVVTASYGRSGNTCELTIRPKDTNDIANKSSSEIDYDLLKGIENELVPVTERGRYVMGTFLDIVCFPEDDDCPAGTQEDWKMVSIYTNAGKTGARYGEIHWNRDECGPRMGLHPSH